MGSARVMGSVPEIHSGSPQLLKHQLFHSFLPSEPENTVTIYTERSTVFAGSSYTLNCTVMSSEFHSVVKWTGLDGNPVHNTSSITVDAPVYDGSKTYVLVLRFHALRTSQAGTYTCHSVVSVPELVRTATKDVVVTGKKMKL